MIVDVRGGADFASERRRLLTSGREELAVAYGRTARTASGFVFLVREAAPAPEQMILRRGYVLEWRPEFTRDVAWRCREEDLGAVFIHAHQGPGQVFLSSIDEGTAARLVPHLANFNPRQAQGYMVVGDDDLTGYFQVGEAVMPPRHLHLTECPLTTITAAPQRRTIHVDLERYDRHILGFGEGLQRRLATMTVAVIGLGGGGSMVSEQLAMAGIGRLILVDKDVLQLLNRPRVVGSTDAMIGHLKVEIAAALAQRAQPSVKVETYAEDFPTRATTNVIKEADVIIAAVDSAAARTAVNEFGVRYMVPFISVGATIRHGTGPAESIHGHVARVMPGGRCLECMGIISDTLRRDEQAHRPPGYGVDGPGSPQVVSINGVLASTACNEVLRLAGAFAGAPGSLQLVAELVAPSLRAAEGSAYRCDVCRRQAGMGDAKT